VKVLLHACCGPCSIYCVEKLREEKMDVDIYWFNPNIHPYMEYKTRKETLEEYCNMINIKSIIEDNYGLTEFCKNTINDIKNRCNYCYRVRVEQTAKYAKENGYDCFTTTLFVSPYQKKDILKRICEEMAGKYKIEFLYRDFEVGFREGQSKAREIGLYMQKYCGCIYSEEERYNKNG